VAGQFIEGLIAEFDSAESDPAVAMRLCGMQLAQGDDSLAVALLIERHCGPELRRQCIYLWILFFYSH
jgi:hypothetical protein